MRRIQRLRRLGASLALATIAVLGTSAIANAQSGPGSSATVTASCASTNQGATCPMTFHFEDSNGNPECGVNVTFTVSGVAGSTVTSPGTTDCAGNVSATFKASTTSCGTATVTATGAGNTGSAQTTINVPCTSGGTPLANTGALPPSSPWWPPAALGLALVTLMGGGLALRRMRVTS